MNFNLISYAIYGIIMSAIVLRVGHACYQNGIIWTNQLFKENKQQSLHLNRILLVGYYLVNLGYVVLMISSWEYINNLDQLIASLCLHIGKIMLLLAVLHFANILGIYLFITRNKFHF